MTLPVGGYTAIVQVSVAAVGQIARDLVLQVDELPEPSGAAPARTRREMLGGKGANQAVSFAQLGVAVALVGVVGADMVGAALLRQLRADGVDPRGVVRRDSGATALVVDLVDGRHQWRYVEDFPPDMLLSVDDVNRSASVFAGRDAVVVQLQQPGAAALAAAERARSAGCRVVLDGAPERQWRDRLLAVADVIRADTHEAELLSGVGISDSRSARRAGSELLRCGPSLAVLGAGDEGNALVWRDGSVVLPLLDVPVQDQTGAGDAFVAGLVAELARGRDAAHAGRVATAAAALAVGRLGGRPALTEAGIARWLAQLDDRPSPMRGESYRW